MGRELQLLVEVGARAISAIPEAVWGAIVGALSVLLGIALQARHDRRLRREDREMTLRRDVFLRAYEAAARLHELFGAVARAYESAETLSDLQAATEHWGGSGAAVSAVELVGDLETVRAFSGLQRTVFAELIAVTQEGLRLLTPKNRVRTLEAEIEDLQRQTAQLISTLQTVSADQRPHYERYALPRFQALQEQLGTRRGELAPAYLELADGKRQLIMRALQASQAVAAQLGEAVVQARREMAIPIDAEEFRMLISQRSSESSAVVERWLAEMREAAVGEGERPHGAGQVASAGVDEPPQA